MLLFLETMNPWLLKGCQCLGGLSVTRMALGSSSEKSPLREDLGAQASSPSRAGLHFLFVLKPSEQPLASAECIDRPRQLSLQSLSISPNCDQFWVMSHKDKKLTLTFSHEIWAGYPKSP